MYDTGGARSVCDNFTLDYDVNGRVAWLKGELARTEGRGVKSTRGAAGESVRSVALSPALTPSEAYAWVGAFVGLFPPAAIFFRFLCSLGREEAWVYALLVCGGMTIVCSLVGARLGAFVGGRVGDPAAYSWPRLFFKALLLAALWGLATGAAGGAVCFGFGALFGPFFAVPVALAAFPLFAVLHRLLSRGGMIEARSLWPLAYGIPGVIAATILSLK